MPTPRFGPVKYASCPAAADSAAATRCGRSRGNRLQEWAWDELNIRPHAHQAIASETCRRGFLGKGARVPLEREIERHEAPETPGQPESSPLTPESTDPPVPPVPPVPPAPLAPTLRGGGRPV